MLRSEEMRLTAALANLEPLLSAQFWKQPSSKNASDSAKARQEGNALYADRSTHNERIHVEILRQYSRSVALAPLRSEELGLAYGNRSALLVHLGRYAESIDDLDRAMRTPLSEVHVAKYLCRKVECQAELGMQEARETCEETKAVLKRVGASDQLKKDILVKLVKAVLKLEKSQSKTPECKLKLDFPNAEKFARNRSAECPEASSSVSISYNLSYKSHGRHLTASRNIFPGEILYVSEPYVVLPTESHQHTNCSHCLKFAWAPLACDECVHAVYCSWECKKEARQLYHDLECKIINKAWKHYERMNTARLMSVRLLILAMREAGGLRELKESLEDVDACTEIRRKGFSNEETVFLNNHRSIYSLTTHIRKKPIDELISVSSDSAVLLHLLARHTTLFRRYFDYDAKTLIKSEDALFVGKLLSHYQHLIFFNTLTVKDTYNATSTDWSWTAPKEENCTGLYITPFLSLLNHSCHPNVTKCEMEDRRTVLYSVRPIARGEQIFDCYGPTYSEMQKKERQELLQRFYFTCNCIACKDEWPIFMNMINSGISYSSLVLYQIDATAKAQLDCDAITEALQNGNYDCSLDTIKNLAHAIIMTSRYCKTPNWRLPSLVSTLTTVFNVLYGFTINVPEKCQVP